MRKVFRFFRDSTEKLLKRLGLGMRARLTIIFFLEVVPLILLTLLAWRQFTSQGEALRDIAVTDASSALNSSAVENIERMTTDTAAEVAAFLYGRDSDILFLSGIAPTEENYAQFVNQKASPVMVQGEWALNEAGTAWVEANRESSVSSKGGISTNSENNDMEGFHYRLPDGFTSVSVPLYDEITFIDLNGMEQVKVVAENSAKVNYPMNIQKRDVSKRENTYVKAETYFEKLKDLKPGEIYVSDVIGAYVGSNYIGMYTPDVVAGAAVQRGYDIPYDPQAQAYSGAENPNGQRFEGIVRWATPVTDDAGEIIGYVTFALNHDHIMEFVDHITPMNERYTELPSAFEGNYAFIWDYKCRSICHPRHHSIVGFDPETGEPQVPWLETSIYDAWQASGVSKWTDFVKDTPLFDNQSRAKKPAPILTQQGLVGLDGRYLNNAPQCTGWMDLTEGGGSGSFYILWSGLYKLTTAAAIPYYTGQYAPSEENGYSQRGFGIVTIGAGMEDFTRPARETEEKLDDAIDENLRGTFMQYLITAAVIIVLVALIVISIASSLTGNISELIRGMFRFRTGERQFRFHAKVKDEFGTLADSFDEMADSIAESVKNSLAITDMNCMILYMNEHGLKFSNKTLEEIVGTSYHENSVYPAGSPYDPILALHEGREADIYYLATSERYIRGKASYFLSKDGEKLGYMIETLDVTRMVHEQIELEKAVAIANSANEHKGEFLARMSHEIRTPMNAIIGITNIVQKKLENLSADARDSVKGNVDQIEASSQHLLGLLNDILDISKIEAGKIELSEETMELTKLAGTVVTIIKPRCDEKHITFSTHFDAFTPSTFASDSLRLRQVLINLLGNAVKFTPDCGGIEFRMENKGQQDGKTLVAFTVRDTGIGISEERLQAIFEPFEQASGKVTRQYGGTGLGLAISQRIVELFGGKIEVDSAPGEGSTFRFSIWLKECESDIPAEVIVSDATDKFAGKRMLLVDDVEINRMIVMAMLENTGIAIDEAEDGDAALQAFRASPAYTYDIILMDVQMPRMDGYEASRSIRALDRPDAALVPIVAQTANAFKEDIDKALAAGMNAHIAKPVEMETLLETLFRFMRLGK